MYVGSEWIYSLFYLQITFFNNFCAWKSWLILNWAMHWIRHTYWKSCLKKLFLFHFFCSAIDFRCPLSLFQKTLSRDFKPHT
jgi:hypothetical protein